MQFKGHFSFLSNMFKWRITYEGFEYSCVESAYQAQKTLDPNLRRKFTELDGYQAKKLGKHITCRENWEEIKVSIMKDLLKIKFSNRILAAKLAAIEVPIVEDNYWNDYFWGVCNGKGQNILGKLLMEIRSEVRSKIRKSREKEIN